MIPWGWLIVAAFGGAAVVYLLWACCVCAGRCSEDERHEAECERCMDGMQERMEQRVREHGNYRYLQGVADQGGPPVDARVVREEAVG